MPKFYFDFKEDGGTTVDNDGEEFPAIEAARREAFAALNESAKDYYRHARHDSAGWRLAIRIRDDDGAIMEVSATFETRSIRS
jgi:hypothetical protein